MENTFDHIDELIGKYLAEEASAAEKAEVEAWVRISDANRKYFDQVKTLFARAEAVREWQQFDEDAAWNRLKAKLGKPEPKTIIFKPENKTALYWRVAASLLLVLSVSYFAYRLSLQPTETIAITAAEKIVQDTLPDGSTAFLNKGSKVSYAYNPRRKTRSVKLEGEAYFDVKHQEEKPFIIETEEVIIEDIGTTFNVKAYPESPTIEVFVETGEVAFYTKENPGLRLVEGETGIYHKESGSFARLTEPDTNILAYKTRVFNFHNTDLGTIAESLNEVYEVKLRIGNSALESCRVNVSFKGEPIEVIADILAETLGLHVTKTANEIILDGSACGEQ